jgi:hypothetical protein
MINSNAISPLSNFDPTTSIADAFQWGQEAFEGAMEDGEDPKHDYDLTTSILQGLLARQTPPNWSLGFAAGYVQAYLKAQQLA